MDIEILGSGAFCSALCRLEPGERFVSESGAMFRASSNIDIDVTTRSRGSGGLLAGVKRLLGAEHFFFSTYSVMDGRAGEVGLAPTLQGEIRIIDVDPAVSWLCAGGSFLGATEELAVDTRFQGLKGMFSGESLFFLEVSGGGRLLVNAFGRIVELEVDGEMIVDTGHVVAFERHLTYEIQKAGGSWMHSFLGGEGLVLNFKGRGRVLAQSHNPSAFGGLLGARLPPRSR